MVTMAVTQALVTMIALVGRSGSPHSGFLEIVCINGFFVALFVGAAVLFRKAARDRRDQGAGQHLGEPG